MKTARPALGIELVAHRGASFDAPENTLAAFQLAWKGNADAVELDLHQTREGRLVVIHDDDTRRTTGVKGKIAGMTLDDIQQLDAGRWKAARFAGEKIPTLEQVLATGPATKRFFVELKGEQISLPLLRTEIERAGLASDQVVLMSFSQTVARAAREDLPLHPVLRLADRPQGIHLFKRNKVSVERLITEAETDRLTGLGLSVRWPIDRDLMRKIHDRGLKVFVWTVDRVAVARRLCEAGVDGIITNRVAWMREKLR